MDPTLPTDLEEFVEQELRCGRYRSREEMISLGLRLLKREREEATQGIRQGLDDVKAGRVQPVDEAFDEVRAELGIPSDE